MSYPPARYPADHGEATARFRRDDTGPDLTYPNGVEVEYLAASGSTDGDYGLYRWTFGPEQSGPGPHFHRTISESFYVLNGTVQIYDGRTWVDARPGDFVHVPPGGLHGFRNVVGEPAQMLLHFAPGAPREGYFEGLLRLARGWRPSEDEVADFYAEHDNVWE